MIYGVLLMAVWNEQQFCTFLLSSALVFCTLFLALVCLPLLDTSLLYATLFCSDVLCLSPIFMFAFNRLLAAIKQGSAKYILVHVVPFAFSVFSKISTSSMWIVLFCCADIHYIQHMFSFPHFHHATCFKASMIKIHSPQFLWKKMMTDVYNSRGNFIEITSSSNFCLQD